MLYVLYFQLPSPWSRPACTTRSADLLYYLQIWGIWVCLRCAGVWILCPVCRLVRVFQDDIHFQNTILMLFLLFIFNKRLFWLGIIMSMSNLFFAAQKTCEAGSYLSSGTCVTCAANSFSESGATACTPCPGPMTSPAGSTSMDACGIICVF